ncbi:MAG: ATP-dependent RecD-like DNA helicase [Desulfamplus sp.]
MKKRQITLTSQQMEAVNMVKNNRLSILSGGPGTGKTTTILEIINWAEQSNMTVLQAAPTGKAAKRMQESTGRAATTIHAMLGSQFDNGQFYFNHNADNPLQADLVILDETSMITASLMASVLDAVEKTRLLLVGDPYQLPSVGAGAVLRDFLQSELFPYIELSIIHRNSGRIVEVCHAIKNGQSYFPDAHLDLDAENPINLIHIECSSEEDILDTVEKTMCEKMPSLGYDPVDQVLAISPVNAKGKLSCLSLNRKLQNRLNPAHHKEAESADNSEKRIEFRAGDKVIQTRNEKVITTEKKPSYIVNGDIGKVVEVNGKDMTVDFFDPKRQVRLSTTNNDLLHAYAITCHRAQGSEAPVVIVPVHRQFNYFLSNSWLYTALSRGREIVITIGNFAAIQKAIQNKSPNNRITRLKQRFIEYDRKMIEAEFANI